METTNLSNAIRQMWDTRPLRAREAPIAGVCTGFARRYQVDVALVRAAFIGATVLGGLGLVAYIAGIFVLPKESEYAYGTRVQRGGPPTIVLIFAAVLAVMFGSGMSSSWPGAGVISLALLLAGWYALHLRLPVPPPGTAVSTRLAAPQSVGAWQPPAAQFPWQPVWTPPTASPQAPAAPQAPQATSASETDGAAPSGPEASAPSEPLNLRKETGPAPQAETQTTEQIHPPRWDPLGAAPFAWDLPEPAAPSAPVPLPTPRSRVTAVTLGAALLVAAGIATVNLIGLASISSVVAASIVLGVVGLGLLYGATRRSGYGLLVAAIPLAGFIVIGTTAQNVMSGFGDAPRGDQNFEVSDAASLLPQYTVQAGSLKLDLREMTLDRDRTVNTHVAMGDTRIRVPESMNVRVACSIKVGETDCPSGFVAGKDAKPGAPTLTINASGNVGEVKVERD